MLWKALAQYEYNKLRVAGINFARRACSIKIIDHIGSEFEQNLCDVEKGLNKRVEESVLGWNR